MHSLLFSLCCGLFGSILYQNFRQKFRTHLESMHEYLTLKQCVQFVHSIIVLLQKFLLLFCQRIGEFITIFPKCKS